MGRYDNLYPAPGRILRSWGIGVVDALNELYGWLTDGTHDINVETVNAIYGKFAVRPIAEGRPVILDGDPISIYQFYDIAQQQITNAIDKSSQLTKIASRLDQIYGTITTIEEYTRETRNVIVKLNIDQYGNIGVKIAEPVDEYGRVVISPPSEIMNEFKPVSAYGSILAAYNTNGFSVVLYKGGRPNVNVYYRLGGTGTVYLKASIDGVTWRTLKTYSLASAGEGIDIIQGIAYPYVMLSTDATGIDVEFEITASR